MWNNITKIINTFTAKELLFYIIILFLLYWAIAAQVFALRHPWATKTEQFLHTKEVLLYKKISYKEVRDMYDK